ncbi:IS110 family transposase [Thermodesulfobacteriota bacterium]
MNFKKTKKVTKINPKTLVGAVDIGKNFQYGYFRAPNGNDTKTFKFFNTRKGFTIFWEKLCRFKKQQGLENVVIGFESTGSFAEPLSNFLKKKPAKLVQVNPVHTKRIKELTGNSPNKTDKKDPRVIADVICLGHALTMVVPQGPAAELRRLTQARERSIKSRTAANNQLHDLIYVIFPELLSAMKPSTKTGAYLLKNYPCPEDIVSLGQTPLVEIITKISRGKFTAQKAAALFEAAQTSVGIKHGKTSIVLEIKYLIDLIENHNQFIDGIEKQMRTYLEQIPYSQNILSIKGIGNVTVAGLIGEVGDFKAFDTIPEIMKLAGLDLYEISSGSRRGQRRISKRGRPLMRKLLFFAAINAVKSGGIMHHKYHQMLDRGMIKIKALVAISRKILGLIFAIARDNTSYIENYKFNHHYKLAA